MKTLTMLNWFPLLSDRKYLETLIMTKSLMGIRRSDELPHLPAPQESSEDEISESQMWKVEWQDNLVNLLFFLQNFKLTGQNNRSNFLCLK